MIHKQTIDFLNEETLKDIKENYGSFDESHALKLEEYMNKSGYFEAMNPLMFADESGKFNYNKLSFYLFKFLKLSGAYQVLDKFDAEIDETIGEVFKITGHVNSVGKSRKAKFKKGINTVINPEVEKQVIEKRAAIVEAWMTAYIEYTVKLIFDASLNGEKIEDIMAANQLRNKEEFEARKEERGSIEESVQYDEMLSGITSYIKNIVRTITASYTYKNDILTLSQLKNVVTFNKTAYASMKENKHISDDEFNYLAKITREQFKDEKFKTAAMKMVANQLDPGKPSGFGKAMLIILRDVKSSPFVNNASYAKGKKLGAMAGKIGKSFKKDLENNK